jgi:integrase
MLKPARPKPYFEPIQGERGLLLGYRRLEDQNGTWVVRVAKDGADWTKAIGKADDYDNANGRDILDFSQAQSKAKEVAGAGKPSGQDTVAAAVDRYEADLKHRAGDPGNIVRLRAHMPAKLGNKIVRSLTKEDLTTWRESLREKLAPASVNRTMTTLRAALNLVAEEAGNRIANREAWKTGLKAISGAGKARNVILDEQDVRTIIGAAYRHSAEFGELIEMAAVTGARTSQLARLQGEDVQPEFTAIDPQTKRRKPQPRVMMPVSRKGKGEKAIARRPVPISEALAERLKGRTGTLLKRPDGGSWETTNISHYFDNVIQGINFRIKSKVTMYALRHTSIVRQLLAGVPIRVVAALHDTSVAMIEKNYSEYIADHADELARPTLLETMAEVITLRKGVPEVPG